ncbi:hypothetical protein [Granulicella tundricola]|uniref:HPr kinase/phosphorylase C-terminal domain-containing protein n=1 Tax=Granulicella tundricola (strain ATCC BAA-1859 / DSM 23138 / MP5ACTX9) TaxID=1198114 RepID=E8X106_GRATM|nr:hypothetical protein [Granulicella tundricola]ADW67872.1 hypothetical protein AciX9_0804 [Granulicella tundricola MP5ACTX9]
MTPPYRAMAFGCTWQSDIPLPSFESDPGEAEPDILVSQSHGPPPDRGDSPSASRLRNLPGGSRFIVEGIATIDTYGGKRAEIYLGLNWSGVMPVEFFGSVSGLFMTWRGAIAMHGSAVEWNGHAILICGHSGAGKSTLAAALIARGARLISDDLSILHPRKANQPPLLYAGRRAMRLFPDIAQMLGDRVLCTEAPGSVDGKKLVVPPRIPATQAVPLGQVIVLDDEILQTQSTQEQEASQILEAHLYRPRAYAQIPGLFLRQAQIKSLARIVPVSTMQRQEARNARQFEMIAEVAENKLT